MDPLSHSVLGRLVTTATPHAAVGVRGFAASSVLGALSPDVDFVLMPLGWDIYLRAHEAGTHSLAGLLITGVGAAAVVKAFARRSPFPALGAAAVAGAISHVFADVVSGAHVRPLWPFWDGALSLPLVSMGDPWTIAIFAAGGLAMWRMRARQPAVSRGVLLVLLLFLTAKGVLLAVALRSFGEAGSGASDRVVEARWASLTEWHVFHRTVDALRQWRVSATGGAPQLVLSRPVDADSALVRASRRLDTVRNFLAVHDLAFAVEMPAAGRRRGVFWSDIRFCWNPESGGSLPGPMACAMWFGGILDPDGRAVRQEVRVGSWIQRRPPPDAPPVTRRTSP